ncbi:MAG TPA: hypothetical protein VF292_14270 [Rhodanobacteraceae bacterium]
MIRHWAFFKQSDAPFGTFYPTHYIVAGYPSMRDAQAAEQAFAESGVAVENVRAAAGDFVINQLEAHHKAAHWLQRVVTHNTGFAGQETRFLEDDAKLARQGGAFLFVFAPDASHVAQARKVFAQHAPNFARRYLPASIEPITAAPPNAAG